MKTENIFETSLTEEVRELNVALEEMAENPDDPRAAQRLLRKIRGLVSRFKMAERKMSEIERELEEATQGKNFDDIAKLADAAMLLISTINRTYTQINKIRSGKKAIDRHPEQTNRRR